MAPDTPVSATLDAIRAIEAAATEGPWRAVAGLWAADGGEQETFPAVISSHGDPAKAETWLLAAGRGSPDPEANAEFAAMARTAIPLLLAAVEAALKQADDWTEGSYGTGSALDEDRGWVRAACGAKVREAVRAALSGTGKEAGDGT